MSVIRPSVGGRLRFDPKRTLEYHWRTMTRPAASWTLSPAEQEAITVHGDAFLTGADGPAPPAVAAFRHWQGMVRLWCSRQGFQVDLSAVQNQADQSVTLTWRPVPFRLP